jgi:glucose/arabinose dehydrogenase
LVAGYCKAKEKFAMQTMRVRTSRRCRLTWFAGIAFVAVTSNSHAQTLTGREALGDWRADHPGVTRRITQNDLPRPWATPSAGNGPRIVRRPADAKPQVPDGFDVTLFAEGFTNPRIIRVAPNGDIFVAETRANRIRVLRATDGESKPSVNQIFVDDLNEPFGIAFYPQNDPQWIYVANTDSVVRFAYHAGDLRASGKPESVVASLPHGGNHSTRDIAFSNDGKRMFVSVGSASNVAEGLGKPPSAYWPEDHVLGAAWGYETDRADVLVFDPEGKNKGIFATGIRNCVGLAVQPTNGELWCSTNERDGLGDDLVPDYVTRVRERQFFGWPWYYIGDNEEPRLRGERPDLKGKITVPDVMIQSHSASLGMTFYTGKQFPAEYQGDAFAAEHGSWNRSKRTGYKVIRIKLKDGVPTGEYQDFMTGFVASDANVWGRPVSVAVAHDGALLVTEDGNGTIWRVSHKN